MANDDAPTRRVISAELVIATFALLASAIASIATRRQRWFATGRVRRDFGAR